MNNTSSSRRHSRPQAVSRPQTRSESAELRDLLEENLAALEALYAEHQRTIVQSLRAVDSLRAELRAELRAFSDARAPWVQALAETRALLYIALQEVIVGDNGAGLSLALPRQAG